jgi:hypothetical protein
MPTDHPDLTKLANAVEQAWEWLYQQDGWTTLDDAPQDALRELHRATGTLVNARRAALAAGYVECLISREAVEALRTWDNKPRCYDSGRHFADAACEVLARDLAALLTEGK